MLKTQATSHAIFRNKNGTFQICNTNNTNGPSKACHWNIQNSLDDRQSNFLKLIG